MKQLFFFILVSAVANLTADTHVYVAPSNVAPSVYVEPGVVPGAGVAVPGAGGVHYEGWGGHGYERGYEHGYHEGYHGGEHGNWNHEQHHEEHHEGHEGHHEGHEGHGGGHHR